MNLTQESLEKQLWKQRQQLEAKLKEQSEQLETKMNEQSEQLEAKLEQHQCEQFQEAIILLSKVYTLYFTKIIISILSRSPPQGGNWS